MHDIFNLIILILVLNVFLCIYRALMGPRAWDRVIAINVIGTKTIVIVILIGILYDSLYFVDVALVYALFNFILTVALSKYIEFGTL
ncbi:MAG: cation:proton antiporter [Candidatus Altiarchaeales archaeon]|nr:MAG: cation:proton antiporter [Candidatus Altiarchaeales archaeon]RLI94036.1 MAG: cation:proton antiporter [Candidatus Altiarchaeales archaeon]HDO81876.1 cation:proton antiporter [Candidatus Altiarchaeales archaeon]HEX54525.1 cation:proton antiporter [Candidatus Altiarchaeales archaeon]